MILEHALLCLAANIFFEARGETRKGQMAVAHVTLNRAKQNPDKVCQVVLKKRQFSWTRKWVSYRNGAPVVTVQPWKIEPAAWQRSVNLAKVVLNGVTRDVTFGATMFHAYYVTPDWSIDGSYRMTAVIGNHTFYRQSKS